MRACISMFGSYCIGQHFRFHHIIIITHDDFLFEPFPFQNDCAFLRMKTRRITKNSTILWHRHTKSSLSFRFTIKWFVRYLFHRDILSCIWWSVVVFLFWMIKINKMQKSATKVIQRLKYLFEWQLTNAQRFFVHYLNVHILDRLFDDEEKVGKSKSNKIDTHANFQRPQPHTVPYKTSNGLHFR